MTKHVHNQNAPPGILPVEDSSAGRRFESQLLGRSVEIALSALPEITAPALDDLFITVPPPQPVTQDLLDARIQALRLEYAHLEQRSPGDLVRQGDLAVLDIVGYSQQRIIPFCARQGLRIRVQTHASFPGFFESLAGAVVGESTVIQSELPASFPVAHLRGELGAFAVEIVEAHKVRLLNLSRPEELARLQMGTSMESVITALLEQIEEELAESLIRRAARLVMERLVERVSPQIPVKLIEEEIRQHWLKREGLFLQQKEIEAEDMEASFSSWLLHPSLREEVERRLSFAVMIRSIAEQQAPPIDVPELDEFIDGLAEELGLSSEEARQSLQQEPHLFQQVLDKFVYIRTLDFVMAQAHIEFADGSGS